MEAGSVLKTAGGLVVVTELENGHVSKAQRLEDYIASVVVVNYCGEPRTIKEIIDIHCDEYLMSHDVKEEA